jgi:transposase
MSRFIVGVDRQQATRLPECLDDFIAEDNTVRTVDVFIDELDLVALGFDSASPAATGRPSYHPSVLLKLYLYGYLNRIQSSRRLERECQRNVELMWLTGRLAPDFKTIADFRRDNGKGIRNVCRRFVILDALETADRTQPAEMQAKTERLQGKIQKMRQRMQDLQVVKASRSSDRICRRLLAPNLDRRQSIYSLVRAEKYGQAIGLLRQARGSSQVGA